MPRTECSTADEILNAPKQSKQQRGNSSSQVDLSLNELVMTHRCKCGNVFWLLGSRTLTDSTTRFCCPRQFDVADAMPRSPILISCLEHLELVISDVNGYFPIKRHLVSHKAPRIRYLHRVLSRDQVFPPFTLEMSP